MYIVHASYRHHQSPGLMQSNVIRSPAIEKYQIYLPHYELLEGGAWWHHITSHNRELDVTLLCRDGIRKVSARHWRRGGATPGCSNCVGNCCSSRGRTRRWPTPPSHSTPGQTSVSSWRYWVVWCRHEGCCGQCTVGFLQVVLTFAVPSHWTPACVWRLGSPRISSLPGTPSGESPASLGRAGPALSPLQQHPVCEGGTGGRPRSWGSPGSGSVGTKSQKSPTSETLLAGITVMSLVVRII